MSRYVWEEMPRVFPEQKMWGGGDDEWKFVITEVNGRYSCSVKRGYTYVLKEYAKYGTLEDAKAACEQRAERQQR